MPTDNYRATKCNSEKCSNYKQSEVRSDKSTRLSYNNLHSSSLSDYSNPYDPLPTPTQRIAAKRKKMSSPYTRQQRLIQRDEDTVELTKSLCKDYITSRLNRSGFRGKVTLTRTKSTTDKTVLNAIINAGQTLEGRYPHLYRNLARQLGYVIKSDEVLRHLFFKLSKNIMGEDPGEFTWCRILSLYCVAGSLAIDCIVQGHSEFNEKLIIIFCEYIETYLLSWVAENGGWSAMAKHLSRFENMKTEKTKTSNHFIRAITTWFAISIGLTSAGWGAYYAILQVL